MEKKVMHCRSCGMPMTDPKMHGAANPKNRYSIYCTDTKGRLKTRAQVKAGMVMFFVKHKKVSEKDAAKFVESYMRRMPAWKSKPRKPKKRVRKKSKKKSRKKPKKRRKR